METKVTKSNDQTSAKVNWGEEFKPYWAKRNAETLANLAKLADTDPEYMLRDCLDAAKPLIEEWLAGCRMFKSITVIWSIEKNYRSPGGWKQAIGFKGGRLVYCDGKTVKPITAKDSMEHYARMQEKWLDDDQVEEDCDARARAKWARMVAAAIK